MANGSAHENLRASIISSLSFSYKWAIAWGILYYTVRAAVIVLSVLISAKAVGVASAIDQLQGLFALA